MAKYQPFNEGKYKNTFDGMYGQGTFQKGIDQAATLGRTTAEAKFAEQLYLERLRAAEAAARAAREQASLTPAEQKGNDLVPAFRNEKLMAGMEGLEIYNHEANDQLNRNRSKALRPIQDIMGGFPIMTNDRTLTEWDRMKKTGW